MLTVCQRRVGGAESDLPAGVRAERTIELAGRWVDAGASSIATRHLVVRRTARSRVARARGTSYADMPREGRLLGTVYARRRAASESNSSREPAALNHCCRGVTTVEIKSGTPRVRDERACCAPRGAWKRRIQ